MAICKGYFQRAKNIFPWPRLHALALWIYVATIVPWYYIYVYAPNRRISPYLMAQVLL